MKGMSSRSGNRRGRGRGGRGRSMARRVTNIQHAINGVRIHPSPDPPSIVQAPWWAVTVSNQFKSDGAVTEGNIYSGLIRQANFPTGSDIVFRVLKARVWDVGGAKLTFCPCDLLTPGPEAAQQYIGRFEDAPGRNHWACAGYVWPKSHQAQCIPAKSAADKAYAIFYIATQSGATTSVVAHVDILWRFAGQSLPSMQAMEMDLDERHSSLSQLSFP